MAMKTFKVAARRKEEITFQLEGEDYVYHFTPPKTAGPTLALLEANDGQEATLAALKGQFDWLGQGLAEGEEAHLIERLTDEDDPLDIPVINEVLEWLIKESTARPTMSRRGSR